MIDLTARITKNFTWSEAIYLPTWGIHAFPTPKLRDEIIATAMKMEEIRKLLNNRPIIVHSWWRPEKYNEDIGGARHSAHIDGLAVDWHVHGLTCDKARKHLRNHLEGLNIRMEANEGLDWLHCDRRAPGPGGRYFKP